MYDKAKLLAILIIPVFITVAWSFIAGGSLDENEMTEFASSIGYVIVVVIWTTSIYAYIVFQWIKKFNEKKYLK